MKEWTKDGWILDGRIPLLHAGLDWAYFQPRTYRNKGNIRFDSQCSKLELPTINRVFLQLKFVTGTCRINAKYFLPAASMPLLPEEHKFQRKKPYFIRDSNQRPFGFKSALLPTESFRSAGQ
jgi:hypothetical protein